MAKPSELDPDFKGGYTQVIKHTSQVEVEDGGEGLDDEGLFEHYTIVVSKGQQAMRLDKYLANTLPFTTRSKIKNASETGTILVNEKEIKISYKVKAGDTIRLMLPFPPAPELKPEPIPLDIRYEDNELLVVHKSPGMVVHPSLGHWSGTLVHGLLWHFQQLPQPKGEPYRPGLVHRIDKDTSGILVVAKEEYAMAHLSKQFFDHSIDRVYNALVWGNVKENKGTITTNIGRSTKDRKIFQPYPLESDQGKVAITHYEVIERFGPVTLIQCKLETGRTHQIRVHMKHLGHTLFSDREYGGDKVLSGNPTAKYLQFIHNCMELLPRQALHAKSLTFTHPHTLERRHFESDLPEDFQSALDKFRKWAG